MAITGDGQKLDWNALYILDSRYYSNYPELDYLSQMASVDINTALSSRSSLTISDSLTSTEDSLATTDTGIQTGRTGILYNTASLALSRMVGATGGANLLLANSITDYEDAEYVNSRTDSATLSGSWGYSSATMIITSYGYSNYSFGATDTGSDDSIGNHFLSLGFEKELSSSSSLSLSGGANYTPDIDERWDWTSDASWEKSFRHSSLSLRYNRGIRSGSGYTAEIEVRERAYMSWSFAPSSSLSATVSGGYTQSTSIPSSRLDATSYNASVGCVWRPYSWLNVNVDYSRFQQWAEGTESYPLSRDRFFVGFTASLGEWRF